MLFIGIKISGIISVLAADEKSVLRKSQDFQAPGKKKSGFEGR
jgi:hypothetical protein